MPPLMVHLSILSTMYMQVIIIFLAIQSDYFHIQHYPILYLLEAQLSDNGY
jgi:hypothetical protein